MALPLLAASANAPSGMLTERMTMILQQLAL